MVRVRDAKPEELAPKPRKPRALSPRQLAIRKREQTIEKVLNEHGSQGWVLKSITAVEVKGRMGPGGVDGLLITFEKQ